MTHMKNLKIWKQYLLNLKVLKEAWMVLCREWGAGDNEYLKINQS